MTSWKTVWMGVVVCLGIVGFLSALIIPLVVGTHASSMQETQRIEACTQIHPANEALACVESVTGQIPAGVASSNRT
jgi:hypothetical protein